MWVVGRRARERRSKVPFDARAVAAVSFLALESSFGATTVRAGVRRFFPSGFEHSLTSHAGAGWTSSPWAAVQWAVWGALSRVDPPTQNQRAHHD
jgi:hypothetical protein